MSYKLATIVRDVQFEFNIEDANKWDLISENVLNLFQDYGFKTLTARMKALGKKIENENKEFILKEHYSNENSYST